jgi:hypothetical protein
LQYAPDIVLTANSTATLRSASESTRASIEAAFRTLDENDQNTMHFQDTGHYVSKAGEARIVWMREPGTNHVLVLTIYSPIP